MCYWPSCRPMLAWTPVKISTSLPIPGGRSDAPLLAEKKIDAFLAAPPDSQQLRAKKMGHVLIDTMMDKPWSQYFCCMVAVNQPFLRKNPVAAKKGPAGDP